MKIYIVEYKNTWKNEGFVEASSQIEAIKWFSENAPANSRIIRIREGHKEGLISLDKIFNK